MYFYSALTFGFLPYIKILNVTPFILLYFIVLLTYFRKGFEPILIAAISGIIFDIFSSFGFGFYTLYFLIAAIVIRLLYQEGMREISLFRYLVIILSLLALHYIGKVALLYFDKGSIDLSLYILPMVYFLLINTAFATVFYPINNYYFDKLKQLENYLKRQ